MTPVEIQGIKSCISWDWNCLTGVVNSLTTQPALADFNFDGGLLGREPDEKKQDANRAEHAGIGSI
jgi:hypothetical protein